MHPPRLARYVLTAVAVVAATLGSWSMSPSAPQAAAAGPESTPPGYLRLAHLSPDTPDVDVYVASVGDSSSSFLLPGVRYGAVSPYRAVPTGSYVVSMRAPGAPADWPPVLSLTTRVDPGSAYTVAGVGRYADLGLQMFVDDLSIPPPGMARVRIVNAAAIRPSVDVALVGGAPLATGVRFAATTAPQAAPIGDWTLRVTAAGLPPADLPVELRSNSVYTVLLVDRDGRLAAELHGDGTGSAQVPVGGVESGVGLAALSWWPEVGLALLAAAAAGAFVVRISRVAV